MVLHINYEKRFCPLPSLIRCSKYSPNVMSKDRGLLSGCTSGGFEAFVDARFDGDLRAASRKPNCK